MPCRIGAAILLLPLIVLAACSDNSDAQPASTSNRQRRRSRHHRAGRRRTPRRSLTRFQRSRRSRPASLSRPTAARPTRPPARSRTCPASTSPPPRRSSTCVVAKQKGYFDDMCLDVDLKPSFSTANYPLVAANEAQFSSGGSFSEVVDYSGRERRRFVALVRRGPHRHRRADREGRPERPRSAT